MLLPCRPYAPSPLGVLLQPCLPPHRSQTLHHRHKVSATTEWHHGCWKHAIVVHHAYCCVGDAVKAVLPMTGACFIGSSLYTRLSSACMHVCGKSIVWFDGSHTTGIIIGCILPNRQASSHQQCILVLCLYLHPTLTLVVTRLNSSRNLTIQQSRLTCAVTLYLCIVCQC